MPPPRLELFHAIADRGSAKVRRYIVDQSLEGLITFRNVAFDEAQAALAAHGPGDVPALWDGRELHQGAERIITRLSQLVDVGRSG